MRCALSNNRAIIRRVLLFTLLAILFIRWRAAHRPVPFAECHSASPILVGTHHKTGTVLLTKLLREACKLLRWRCAFNHEPSHCDSAEEARSSGLDLCFLEHGVRFKGISPDLMGTNDAKPKLRFIHAIRDPLEVVVSGYMYHLTTTEKWALRPERRWNSTTYVKWLNALPTQRGLVAELRHSQRDSLKTMPRLLARTTPARCTLTLKFEDFASDWQATTTRLWHILGVVDDELIAELGRRTAKHNVWSGRGRAIPNRHVSAAPKSKRDQLRSLLLNASGVREELAEIRRKLSYPVRGDAYGLRDLMEPTQNDESSIS